MIHDRLVYVFPASAPSSVYKILIILNGHGVGPHAIGAAACLVLAIAAAVEVLALEIFHDARRKPGPGSHGPDPPNAAQPDVAAAATPQCIAPPGRPQAGPRREPLGADAARAILIEGSVLLFPLLPETDRHLR